MTGKILDTSMFEKFHSAFTAGLEGIAEAARIYVESIDADPANKLRFLAHFDGQVPPTIWKSLEKVGRKQIHPQLLLGVVGNATDIKRLPYSEQEKVINGDPLILLTDRGEQINVDLRTAPKTVVNQLVASDHVRSLAEQKLYLLGLAKIEAADAKVQTVSMPYNVKGSKIYFTKHCVLTKKELGALWNQMNS